MKMSDHVYCSKKVHEYNPVKCDNDDVQYCLKVWFGLSLLYCDF